LVDGDQVVKSVSITGLVAAGKFRDNSHVIGWSFNGHWQIAPVDIISLKLSICIKNLIITLYPALPAKGTPVAEFLLSTPARLGAGWFQFL